MQDYQGLYNLKTTTCFFSIIQTSGSKGERFSSWHGIFVILTTLIKCQSQPIYKQK